MKPSFASPPARARVVRYCTSTADECTAVPRPGIRRPRARHWAQLRAAALMRGGIRRDVRVMRGGMRRDVRLGDLLALILHPGLRVQAVGMLAARLDVVPGLGHRVAMTVRPVL